MLHAALVVGLALGAAPDRTSADTLTQLVAVSADRAEGIRVLSRKDVEDIVALEGEKAAMGCDDGGSCLAEVAGALGARLVIFGQLGALGDQLILTLNLFDAETATSEKRAVARAEDLGALSDKIDGLVDDLLSGHQEVKDLKLFVMDLSVAGGDEATSDAPAPAPAPAGPDPMLITGVAASGVGLVGLGVGGVLGALANDQHRLALDQTTTQRDAKEAQDTRNGLALGANIGFIVGGAALVAGGVAIGLAVVGGE